MTNEGSSPGRTRAHPLLRLWCRLQEKDGIARDYFWPLCGGIFIAIISNIGLNYRDTSILKISSDKFVDSIAWGVLAASFLALYRIVGKVRRHTKEIPDTVHSAFGKVAHSCACKLADQLCHIATLVRAKSGIEDFHPDHIEYFHDLAENLRRDHNPRRIIATDSSLAHQWWENSMIGYLAIQARIGLPNGVSRLFVWEPHEIGCDEGRKIIMLHRFLGFDTYVITKMAYEKFLEEYLAKYAGLENIGTHDFLVFDTESDKKVELDALSAEMLSLFDGKRTVEIIIDLHKDKWHLSFFESRGMIVDFIRRMTERNIVVLIVPEE